MSQVILVNNQDEPIGIMDKLEVHQKGQLHRAFSIFIFNRKGEMLLQQRAAGKYHSANLWTNACCSHPLPGEGTLQAAHRRLQEELSFDTNLEKAFHFTYKTSFDNGLIEHEYDHVYIGKYDGDIHPNGGEVSDYCFLSMQHIRDGLQSDHGRYTSWFKIAFPKLEDYLATLH